MSIDYRQYYDLESYLFDTVQPRFHEQGCLSVEDFFCILIWKANRSKTKLAKRLREKRETLADAVCDLTKELAQQKTDEAWLRVLIPIPSDRAV